MQNVELNIKFIIEMSTMIQFLNRGISGNTRQRDLFTMKGHPIDRDQLILPYLVPFLVFSFKKQIIFLVSNGNNINIRASPTTNARPILKREKRIPPPPPPPQRPPAVPVHVCCFALCCLLTSCYSSTEVNE